MAEYKDYCLTDLVSGQEIVKENRIAERFPELMAYVQKIRLYTDGNIRVLVRDIRGNRVMVYSGRLKNLTDASWLVGDSEMCLRDGFLYLAAGDGLCMGRYEQRKTGSGR